jgi:hypothetical protein
VNDDVGYFQDHTDSVLQQPASRRATAAARAEKTDDIPGSPGSCHCHDHNHGVGVDRQRTLTLHDSESWIITGTSKGISKPQRDQLWHIFWTYAPVTLRHGDCIGADATAHSIAVAHGGIKIWKHPSDLGTKRAWCAGGIPLNPEPPLMRNHRMIDAAAVAQKRVIALPAEDHEVLRSGTWSTVRYAVKQDVLVFVIWPDGHVTDDDIDLL